MIVKKVKNPRKSATKAARVRGLVEYIAVPERAGSDEKCVYAGARGFLSTDLESQKAEMLALAQEAVRSKDTLNHYVISWREGEQPSPRQVEEAIDIFLDELGLQDHQAIYGLHADTDNLHLHLAVNRVHPETLKVIKPNKGFDIEAAHRAIARIEHAQGWQREHHGRYQVIETERDEIEREKGHDLELARVPRAPDRTRQPASPKRDMEQRTGEKSAERIAIEEGAPVIRRAASWQQIHRELAERGMRYEKTGSGATLLVGGVRIKASSADREASLAKLQRRLGPYEAAPECQPVTERAPEPVQRGVSGWATYIADRKAHQADKSAAQSVATLNRSRRQESERKQLAAQQERRRAELLQGRWQGRGELREALQSILAAEQAAEKAALAESHRAERGQERDQARQRFGAYPDLEQWQRQQGRPELAERWRYRASEAQQIKGVGDKGVGDGLARPRDIRGFVAEIFGREVHYRRRAEASKRGVATRETKEPEVAFIDKGPEIEVFDWQDRDTTLAALQLGAQKWGRMEVEGNDNYKAMCASLAAEHGFEVTNPELQERIRQIKAERSGKNRTGQEPRQDHVEPIRALQRRALRARDAKRPPEREAWSAATAGSALDSYRRHYRDVSRQHGEGEIDSSRLDALVAVRMRVTGHRPAEIEAALRQAAAAREQGSGRDWGDYARRTTRYAFSVVGERQVADGAKYRQRWERLEGRELAPKLPQWPEREQPEQQRTIERKGPTRGR